MLFLGGCKEFALFREIRGEDENQERDHNGDDAFNDEDPSPTFFALYAVHVAYRAGKKSTEARTESAKTEEYSISHGSLSACVVLGDQEQSA